jgi:hypothetical protein
MPSALRDTRRMNQFVSIAAAVAGIPLQPNKVWRKTAALAKS